MFNRTDRLTKASTALLAACKDALLCLESQQHYEDEDIFETEIQACIKAITQATGEAPETWEAKMTARFGKGSV